MMKRSWIVLCLMACNSRPSQPPPAPALPASLAQVCQEVVGSPRVLKVRDHVFVAVGFDLANTILIRTPEGNVVVDAMSSPSRAAKAKAALLEKAPGPIRVLIYTHSHLDHVGGASVWIEPGTRVIAGAPFTETFVERYGTLQRSERARAARQHGHLLSDASLPCSSIGRRLDFTGDIGQGARLPTKEVRGREHLVVGGTRFELISAPGETDDQLYVSLPDDGILLVGDNYYEAFPNLYTIRGTLARKAEPWVASLDLIRKMQPELLIPSHTLPVEGRDEILKRVTSYRDAIAWIRAAVVRGANAGWTVDQVVAAAALPAHLAQLPWLRPLYGEVEWSARAYYGQAMGWFDGRVSQLYPLTERERMVEDLALMGGLEAVEGKLAQLLKAGKDRYVLDLLDRLALVGGTEDRRQRAEILRRLAAGLENSNARAYLLVRANELENRQASPGPKPVNAQLLEELPIESFFESMSYRLRAQEAADVEETLEIELSDLNRSFFVTVRRGVAEVTQERLAGQPDPIGAIRTTAPVWKGLALKQISQVKALASGALSIESPIAVARFLGRFDTSL